MSTLESGTDPTPNGPVGVLLVHGIGTQTRGRTLVDWTDTLASWVNRWALEKTGPDSPALIFGDATLTPADPSEPAHVSLQLTLPNRNDRSLLIAESWWAETVLPPSYGELLQWSFVVVPWTIFSHFLSRLRSTDRKVLLLWRAFTMLAALLLMPLLLAALILLLLLGLLPVPQLRALAGALQRGLASTIGDSLVLLSNAVQRAAIVARVKNDLQWLHRRCEHTIVVAHSQGAAIAHMALRTSNVSNITLITFGSGLAKLLETEWLMSGGWRKRSAPWLFSLASMLLAIGLWRSIGALWQMRDEVAIGVAIYLAVMAVLSFFESRLSKGAILAIILAGGTPLFIVMWRWFDQVGWWPFLLLAAFYGMIGGAYIATSEKTPKPASVANVSMWLDLPASKDLVSNTALFPPPPNADIYTWINDVARRAKEETAGDATPGCHTSVEVWNLRSPIGDHTAYWRSADDFVAKVVYLISQKAGLGLFADEDLPGLRRASDRRRWRTAWLAAARLVMLLSPLAIVGSQGLATRVVYLQSGTDRPLVELQRGVTAVLSELIAGITPESIKTRVVLRSEMFVASPAVVGLASLLLLLLLIVAGSMIITWRWRAWDHAELTAMFDRREARVLDPQFVIFLMVTAAIVEIIAFTVLGWVAQIGGATTDRLAWLAYMLAASAGFGAYWHILRTLFFYVGVYQVRTAVRGVAAAASTCLLIAPLLAWDFANHPTSPVSQLSDLFVVRTRYAPIAIVLLVWLLSGSRLWQRVEPIIARWSHARPTRKIDAADNVPRTATA